MILFWRWWRAVGDLKHIYWVILIYEFTDKIALIGPSPMTPTEVRAKIRALVLHVILHAQCCMYFSTILCIRKNVKLEKKHAKYRFSACGPTKRNPTLTNSYIYFPYPQSFSHETP